MNELEHKQRGNAKRFNRNHERNQTRFRISFEFQGDFRFQQKMDPDQIFWAIYLGLKVEGVAH